MAEEMEDDTPNADKRERVMDLVCRISNASYDTGYYGHAGSCPSAQNYGALATRLTQELRSVLEQLLPD